MSFTEILIWTFVMAFLPVYELRGAIPWGFDHELNIWTAFGVALLGNILVGIIIIVLLKPILNWLKTTKWFGNFADNLTAKFEKHAGKIGEKKKFWGVMTFVAIPLPLTGVWTGAAIAAFLNMPFWTSVLSLSLGAAIAGLLIALATVLLGKNAILLTYAFAIFAVVLVTTVLLVMLLKKKPAAEPPTETKKESVKEDITVETDKNKEK
jgi:uncharacterized membrane protein